MLAYIGTVIVILLNILIAQMSTTYTQAKRVARLEYDVDRILQLTRMERFPFLVCELNTPRSGRYLACHHVRGRVHARVECLYARDSVTKVNEQFTESRS